MMKQVLALLLYGVAVCQGLTSNLKIRAADGRGSDGLDGVRALVKRQIPLHANAFVFERNQGEGDEFVLSDDKSKIKVQCTTVSACSRGLYTYLADHAGVDISWTGSTLNHAIFLPRVGKTTKGSAIVPHRYYFNTVTFSYTAAFFDFDQWSHLLDYMALKGINLPLQWVGYEHTLVQVLREIGLKDEDVLGFLSGPAFQAWFRFGNIQGSWGGTLPEQWINDQFTLGKQIVARMVELGMTPILPCITGFVPDATKILYPNASIVLGGEWNNFPTQLTQPPFLDPFEDLYHTMQKSFIAKQKAAFGDVTNLYTLDQYNENEPFSGELDYLRNVSSNTFQSLTAADPDAIMVTQGWAFFSDINFWTLDRVNAYLGGITDPDRILVLDLYSEAQPQWQRTQNYFGKSWVFCLLHGFGGNQGMEGNFINATVAPLAALNSPNNTMKGMGITMEGQEGNQILYDIFLDQAWSSAPLPVDSYVSSWASRRYAVGTAPSSVKEAWATLGATVYNNSDPNSQATVKSILELAPALSGLTNRTGHHPTKIFYDTNTTIVPALKSLLKASKENILLRISPEYAHDVVDITRQLLVNRFVDVYVTLVAMYNNPSSTAAAISTASKPLLKIVSDLDELLYTNKDFLLSTWIKSARDWATDSHNRVNETYAAYLEYNARNQITLWGPDGEINDYASKQIAGLVGTYYLPRWTMFTEYLAETKKEGVKFDPNVINAQMLAFGKEWDLRTWGKGQGEVWGTKGNTWAVVDSIVDRYT